MAKNSKDFLVSVADVAFYVDGALAFTGTTALNTSISVSMEGSIADVVDMLLSYQV